MARRKKFNRAFTLKSNFFNADSIEKLQKNMWKPTEDMKNKESVIKGGLFYGTPKQKFECAELSRPFRTNIKDFLKAPKDEDLITPIYRRPLCWQQDRVCCKAGSWCYLFYLRSFVVLYNLESGDFEVFDYFGSGKPSVWQRLWLRFKVWRMRCKVRKALRQK